MLKELLKDCGICYGTILGIVGFLVLSTFPLFNYILGIAIIAFSIYCIIEMRRLSEAETNITN